MDVGELVSPARFADIGRVTNAVFHQKVVAAIVWQEANSLVFWFFVNEVSQAKVDRVVADIEPFGANAK